MGFYQRNKNELEEIAKPTKNALDEMEGKYVYNRPAFKIVNNEKFLATIRKMEAESKETKAKLDGFKFPFVLVFFTLFIWY